MTYPLQSYKIFLNLIFISFWSLRLELDEQQTKKSMEASIITGGNNFLKLICLIKEVLKNQLTH